MNRSDRQGMQSNCAKESKRERDSADSMFEEIGARDKAADIKLEEMYRKLQNESFRCIGRSDVYRVKRKRILKI